MPESPATVGAVVTMIWSEIKIRELGSVRAGMSPAKI